MDKEVQLTFGRICRAALKQSTALSYSADRLNRTPRPIYKTRRGEYVREDVKIHNRWHSTDTYSFSYGSWLQLVAE